MSKWHPEAMMLDKLAYEIGSGLRKYFRMNVSDMKYKFYTVRIYCSFGIHSLHDLIYPGYAYSQFPKWLWNLDCRFGYPVMRYTGISELSFRIHKWAYRRAYRKAIGKYKHFRTELLNGADYRELLKGL